MAVLRTSALNREYGALGRRRQDFAQIAALGDRIGNLPECDIRLSKTGVDFTRWLTHERPLAI